MSYDFYDDVKIEAPAAPEAKDFTPNSIVQTAPDLLDEPVKTAEPGAVVEQEAAPAPEPVVDVVPEVKKHRAKFQESELEIPHEAKFVQKVDGSEVEVSLQELLNNFSGKQAWEKKFSDLDKDRQAYKSDLEQVNSYISEFANQAKTDPVKALEYLASSVGLDALEFRKTLRNQFIKAYSPLMNMSEQDRRLMEIQEENEYFKSNRELELNKKRQEQANLEFQASLQKTQADHGIDNGRMQELVSDLRTLGKIENPTMMDVIELHKAYSRQDRAFAALQSVNPEFIKDDEKLIAVESLLAGNSNLSDEQLKSYVEKLWTPNEPINKSVENLANKLNKGVQQTQAQPQPKFADTIAPRLKATGRLDFL